MEVSSNIKAVYSEMYDPSIIEWRTMAAKDKAKNIIDVSAKLKFNNVLEVGCGEGSILSWLSKWNFSENLYGIDISESGIEITKSKNINNLKEALTYDGYHIPYENNHFDLIICSHVMEHVEHERVLLREIKRVSKYQIFEVPTDFSFYVDKKLKYFLSYGHINIYTPALFRFLILSEKFIIVREKCNLYENNILNYLYKGSKLKLIIVKIKRLILKSIPYLSGIKPNSYVVLTVKDEKEISIFESE